MSEPLLDQGRPSSLVPGARMAAKTIEVPGTAPLLPLIKAFNEIFPTAGQRKSGTVVGKGRKINKEKLKAVLTAIDCMDDEDMEEANSDPPGTLLIPSPINPGSSLQILNVVAKEKDSFPDYDSDDSSDSAVFTASCDSPSVNDLSDLNHSIFTWESYECFTQFCDKIGICIRDKEEGKKFLNTI